MKFSGKKIVITGATSGIGKALTYQLHKLGAHVLIHGRNLEVLSQISNDLSERVDTFCFDLSEKDSAKQLANSIKEKHQEIDGLILNAAEAHFAYVENCEEDDYDRILDINLKSTFFLTKYLIPNMTKGGSIILNSSVAGKKGMAGMTVYAMTKAAMRSLARGLSLELVSKGIRVNSVSPGIIDTTLYDKMNTSRFTIESIKKRFVEFTPMQRMASKEEVVGIFIYLLSTESSFVTGSDFDIDGGIAQV